MLGDGVGATLNDDPAFVRAYNNRVLNTTNYGIAIGSGHDIQFYSNTVTSTGKLPDGQEIADQNVGLYIWDSRKLGPTRFYKNSAHDNSVGWALGDGRNDWWTPNATSFLNNHHLPL